MTALPSSDTDTDTMRAGLWLLLTLAIVPYFVGLGSSSIWDANEAFYVETPRQMVLTGDYVNPSFNGQPRFNKPVLSYWVVAGLYRVFGVSVGVERVGITLGAMGLLLATFVIGRLLRSTRVGLIAALMLASSPRVLMWSRRIFIDVYLALFMALTLMFFALAMGRPERRRTYLVLMYLAIGLGVLTKGPVAVALPALTCLVYCAWTRQFGQLRRLMLPWGALIVLAIVTPWYAAVFRQHGWRYIYEFFVSENLGRYTETIGIQHRGPFFYLPELLTGLFPWALLLPAAVFLAVQAVWRVERRDDASRHLTRLLLVWIAAFVGVFSLSSTKQDLYILPIVPAVAVLIAAWCDEAFDRGPAALRTSLVVVAGMMIVVGAGMIWLFGPLAGANRVGGAALVGSLVVCGAMVAAVCVIRRALVGALFAVGVATVLANWVLVLVALPAFERYKPVVPMTNLILARASPTAVVANYKTVLPSMVFYLGRPVMDVLDDMPVLVRLADETPELYVVIRPDEYADLQRRVHVRTCVLDRRPLPEPKIGDLITRQPWPELWLAGVNEACR